jgi:cytochrome c peroxidase
MRRSSLVVLSSFLLLGALVAGCGQTQPPPAPAQPSDTIDPARLSLFATLPEVAPAASGGATQEMVDLGRMLYFEPRLSKSQQISCNSCHDLASYGVDGQPTSDGHKGQMGTRNSPTVYNAALHIAQFWDGRAPDVEAQAKGPVLNPIEMAMGSEQTVVSTLQSMPEYVDAFKKAFPKDPKPITYDNMAAAIGAFERRLMTPSRWDAFLKGDQTAMTADERMGFNLFVEAGCPACHGGPLVGGGSYQRLGAVKPYPRADDPGRFDVTKQESDRLVFKVPSLRNVEKTGPYFHDGRVASLEEAVREMAEYQLGRALSDAEVGRIVAFLRVLTGRLPEDYIKAPTLPKSTAKTPKPDLS